MPDLDKIEDQENRAAGREIAAEDVTIQAIMSTYEGRWTMWNLLTFCAPMHSRYKFDGDVYGAMVRDGHASVGAHLMGLIDRAAPEMYLRMLRDHQTRLEKQREREKTKTTEPGEEFTGETALERMAEKQRAESAAAEARATSKR